MSGIINKIKEAVHSDKHSAPEGTHGPHNSRVANAADPRVDSDRDGSNTMGTTTGRTAGHGEYGSGMGTGATMGDTFGSTGNTFGSTGTKGTSEGTHGPHSSRLANAADPRVDSDRDGSRNMGAAASGTGTGMGMGTSQGLGGSTGNTFGSDNTYGAGSGATGMTGTHGASAGTYGPHSSRMANTADPRVDSDRDGRGAIGTGPGPASNTAGPHGNDMLNKIDPRVDSDLDGSKTLGGNKTYQQGGSTGYRDPTDAAQVPPSVLQKTIGGVQIAHGDHGHQRERRNSIKSHQETFRGV